jgi:hypothetical protein
VRRVADVAIQDDDVRVGVAELRQRQAKCFTSRFAELHEFLVGLDVKGVDILESGE